MGTGNALRATETFTLIQLEEERQKLKKKELLKSMLTDSEFSIKGQCAINLMMTKLDIINTFLLMKYKRNFIQMKTWRLKSYDSVCKKMQKKGLDLNFDLALEKINDLIGVRAVCAYVDDIYKVADLIEKQQDIHILKIKDYVQQPKKSGYQSLHLILEIAIPFQKENQWIHVTGFVEDVDIYLKTAALAVFPLTLGAGIKLKVLRSLALGTAVITGNVGAEGIDEDYQVIIPAETDEEYEKQIVEYLNDPEKRSLRAMESRNYIKEHFSWKISERILAQVYGDGKQ